MCSSVDMHDETGDKACNEGGILHTDRNRLMKSSEMSLAYFVLCNIESATLVDAVDPISDKYGCFASGVSFAAENFS